jgi:hypothetical protein
VSKVAIGTNAEGKTISIDLNTLITSRLLITANSGGGKSYLVRRLLEESFGKIQQIVIDPEGEFATLREKYPYVLVGPGGETPADIRSASLLAEKLLALNASAICDIYEMKTLQRHAWVRLFLEALINAPKKLWHPCLVIVDEAHIFCPEKGMGESEALGAMTDLCTRGRKRGFCAVFATQRLSKFSKNASAELQNRLVGPTFEDVDRERSVKVLGVAKAEEKKFLNEIQLLEPGNFYALGRAISLTRELVKVGKVQTSHPQPGSSKYSAAPPPAPEEVSKFLPQLADLPKSAEEKAKTETELRKENRELKLQLTKRPTQEKTVVETKTVEVPVIKDSQLKSLERILEKFGSTASDIGAALGFLKEAYVVFQKKPAVYPKQLTTARIASMAEPVIKLELKKWLKPTSSDSPGVSLPPGEKAVLIAAGQFEGVDRDQLSVLTGYKRSSRDAYIARLITRGFVTVNGKKVSATQEGVDALGSDYEPLPTGSALQEYWHNRLPEGEKKILEILVSAGGEPVEREFLDESTGYKRSSRDAYLSRLAARRLVESCGPGQVKASATLFD